MHLAAIRRGATVLIATLILCLDSPQLTGRATVIVDIASLDPDRAELIRAHGVDGDGRFGTSVAGPMDMDRESHADFAMAYMRFSLLGRLGASKVNLVFGHGAICAIIDTAVSQESGLKLPGDVAGVGCGKGRNDTLRTIQRFCHLYSPVSRMWAQPRGEMCGRNSGTTGRPACLRLATASPSRAVFQ